MPTEVKGLENFNKLNSIIDKGVSRSLLLSGLLIQGKAQKKFKPLPGLQVRTSKRTGKRYYYYKGKVPGNKPHIRSGMARMSITTTPKNPIDKVIVGSNLNYFKYFEIGTSTQRPRPVLRTSALESRREIQNIFRNIIGGQIKVTIT